MRTYMAVTMAAVFLAGGLAGGVADAKTKAKPKAKPRERYYLQVDKVVPAEGISAAVADAAKATFLDLLSKRPEFVMTMEGAPDPATDVPGYLAYLKKHKLKAYTVELRVDKYERSLAPLVAPKKGQLLTISVAVSVLGADIPEGSWAMTGDGSASIAAEVGTKVSAKLEERITGETLTGALTQAVDRALLKLTTHKEPPRKK